MQIDLTGKKALIGGSSKGLGLAVASALAEAGATVTLMARDVDQLNKLIKSLPSQGQQHTVLQVDFSSFSDYEKKINAFFEQHTIDILINNTQGPPAGYATELPLDAYQTAFDLLFKCAVCTTQLALPHMQKMQWGRIINISSVTVKEPLPQLALSNSIRAGLAAWAKSLSLEVAKDGITVNSILTGYFNTDRLRALNQKKATASGQTLKEVEQQLITQIPAQRFGDPKSYGYLATFLASPQADYITGTNLPIDGGLLHSF
jgi:3-oxoacyl-[acyl-carrier protein] reductase